MQTKNGININMVYLICCNLQFRLALVSYFSIKYFCVSHLSKLLGAVWIQRSVKGDPSVQSTSREGGPATYIGIFIDLSWKPYLPWLKGFWGLNASSCCTSISNAIFEVQHMWDLITTLVSSSRNFWNRIVDVALLVKNNYLEILTLTHMNVPIKTVA